MLNLAYDKIWTDLALALNDTSFRTIDTVYLVVPTY